MWFFGAGKRRSWGWRLCVVRREMDGCRSVIAGRLLPHNTSHHQSHSQATCHPQISLLFFLAFPTSTFTLTLSEPFLFFLCNRFVVRNIRMSLFSLSLPKTKKKQAFLWNVIKSFGSKTNYIEISPSRIIFRLQYLTVRLVMWLRSGTKSAGLCLEILIHTFFLLMVSYA